MHFNPRSPRGGATTSFLAKSVALLFQSTLPTRGSDLWQRFSAYICRANFNPRSPRGGATCAGREFCGHLAGFQSTLPTRGSDIIAKSTIRAKIQFQSTLPTRGSDVTYAASGICDNHFNPRSPRGGATPTASPDFSQKSFQSTLPTRGSDLLRVPPLQEVLYFNPRSPRGGATIEGTETYEQYGISIHAPHEGERRGNAALKERKNDFNPRSPRGGATRSFLHHQTAFMNFNPRSPRGGATYGVTRDDGAFGISIHAPHEGERQYRHSQNAHIMLFQSTLPTRGSDYQSARRRVRQRQNFNPRSPRGGATIDMKRRPRSASISIHAPHEGERPSSLDTRNYHRYFNPRSPRGGATIARL